MAQIECDSMYCSSCDDENIDQHPSDDIKARIAIEDPRSHVLVEVATDAARVACRGSVSAIVPPAYCNSGLLSVGSEQRRPAWGYTTNRTQL